MEIVDDGLGEDQGFYELLSMDVYSVADWTVPGVAKSLGAAFDESGIFKPSLWGWAGDDPLRFPVDGPFADVVESWVPHFSDNKNSYFPFQRPGTTEARPQSHGTVHDSPSRCGMPLKKAHEFTLGHEHSSIELLCRMDWFEQRLDRLAVLTRLFVELCRCSDAFYGWVEPVMFSHQRRALLANGYEAGTIPRWRSGGAREEMKWTSIFVEDVCWLQFFGPSFVEKWGRERFEGLGVWQEWTSNGGVAVMATDTPFVYEPLVDRIGGYAWKQPFYEALGPDVFRREGMTLREPGEVIPTYYHHAAHLRDGPSASTAEVIERRLRELQAG